MRKNILQIIGSFNQGGTERQAVQLTKLLLEHGGHNVSVAALNSEGVLKEELTASGISDVPEFKLDSFFNFNFVVKVARCARFMRANRIDIVHTHDFYTNVFGVAAAKLARVGRIVASKRETLGVRTKSQESVEKQVLRMADAIVTNSSAVRDFLQQSGLRHRSVEVIHNGIDLDRLAPKLSDRASICDLLGLPSGDAVSFVTLVANLSNPVKNQRMLLRAAAAIKDEFPNVHFVLAGEGQLRPEIEGVARALSIGDRTHFIGACRHVPELLHISQMGVLTSLAEGFSNSILEYMAAGLPVVATDVGGAREAVDHGDSGFLVESDDDASLAEKLKWLLRHPDEARAMGERGRQIVQNRFSSKTQLDKILKVYGAE